MKLIDNVWNRLLLKYYRVAVGSKFVCDGKLVIQGKGTYKVGENVHIISKELLNPVGGNRTVLQTLNQGAITIGNNVGISHAILCARECICIEDNVLIGGGVKMYDNDFHPLNYENRINNRDELIMSAPITIREGAFIGAHSIILKGVTIGRHSIVGAGSVVTTNIADGEVWAGNPAKYIKKIE